MRYPMQLRLRLAGRRMALATTFLTLAGCSDITDSLLDADDPDVIPPGSTANAEGAIGLAYGAIDTFRNMTGANESTWLFGGLLADEWSTSSTFPQNDETDQRHIQLNNSQVTAMLYRLYRTRTRATRAIEALKKYNDKQRSLIAELYLSRGFAEMQLALDFCNGIPMGTFVDGEPVAGDPLSNQEVFQLAAASLDSAVLFADSTSSYSVQMNRAARITKARVLMAMGQDRYAEAAALVADIPTSFTYQHTFSLPVGTNTIWGQGLSARRYAVGDSLEGNSRNIFVKNALPFVAAKDPRLPVTIQSGNGQDGLTRSRTTTLYGQLTAIDVTNGIDARMIEAEAALYAGDVQTWLDIHNALRAAPPKLGDVQPAAMAALTDPGNAADRISLHFREKAFWTFSRGQRLGDLRRLVRQYGRAVTDVFPEGIHYKGGVYGADTNLPIVTDEENNPNFHGCTDRNP